MVLFFLLKLTPFGKGDKMGRVTSSGIVHIHSQESVFKERRDADNFVREISFVIE